MNFCLGSRKHAMNFRLLLTLVVLAQTSTLPAFADTEINTAGEEITFLNAGDSLNPDAAWYGRDSLQMTPSLSVLPEADPVPEQPLLSLSDPAEPQDNLWQRIRLGYAMPELNSPFTSNHESWYAARPDYVKRMVGRSEKYLYHIVEEVQKRGMPTEIALLPMVESAFNPQAYSRSKASGIWQFIPSTGKHFGLKQTWWVDNRRDVMAATDAALDYLQKLHVMFGSWDLALAAYNAGEGTVMRAIEKNRRKGLPTDYQSLSLPPETRNYVPKLQAVKNIVSNPEQYGLNIQPIANQPYFTRVSVPNQIDAALAARLAGISFEEFSSLNPEYNRPVLTTEEGSHEILLPVGAETTFAGNLASYDKPLVSWQTYYARRGERQEAIARKFGISLAQLRDVNDLPARNKMRMPRQLLVPSQGNATGSEALATPEIAEATPDAPQSGSARRYKVRKGDTLGGIAARHGITSKQLAAMNKLKGNRLKPGQILLVEAAEAGASNPDAAEKPVAQRKHYVVRKGDTLASIARKFEVATVDLQRWNKLSSSRITPGHKLKILKPDAA